MEGGVGVVVAGFGCWKKLEGKGGKGLKKKKKKMEWNGMEWNGV